MRTGSRAMKTIFSRAVRLGVTGLFTAGLIATAASAQQRVNGAIQEHGLFQQKIAPDAIKVLHGSEFKGAHRVAIASFAVAFPSENQFFAAARGGGIGALMGGGAKAYMDTSMTGVDRATQQRITDKAFALFKARLTAAGYEVVDQTALAAAAPEYAAWTPVPSFSQGRFGTYIAPTGERMFWNQADTAKRDTSGQFGALNATFRTLETPVLYKRSPYIAHDGKLGIITVTLVVDYGVNSSNGEIKYGKAKVGFVPGVNIAAGNLVDRGSFLEYWGQNSGGFPAYALIQQPIVSSLDFATGSALGDGLSAKDKKNIRAQDVHLVADPAKFEAAADEVVAKAVPALVATMTAAK